MTELIPMNNNGLFVNKEKEVLVDSRKVAEYFDKEHKNVLQDIRNLESKLSDSTQDIGRLKFEQSSYKNIQNKKQPCYLLNKDAFMLLAMGYTSQKAIDIKVWYINQFNNMEQQLQSLLELREDYPDFTKALKEVDIDNPYRFSTENDLVYKIATGLRARDWRKMYNVEGGQSIRPYLTSEQLDKVKKVQKYDSVLLDLYDDYHVRKALLIKKFGGED